MGIELKTVEDVIDYMQGCDSILIRKLEEDSDNQHYVENWDMMKDNEPLRVDISRDLYQDCFTHGNFDYDPNAPLDGDEICLRYFKGK